MTDTLTIDTAVINAWRANGDYDYEREIARSGETVWDRLNDAIGKLLGKLFGNSSIDSNDVNTILIIIGIVLLLALVAFIIYKRPAVFFRNKKAKTDYKVTEDTIYGIDFDKETSRAIERKDWREAVRLTYLKLLRKLSDGKLIDWKIYKTPTQYAHEFINSDFRRLSNLFLRIRYSGVEATEDDYVTMNSLAKSVETMVNSDANEEKAYFSGKGGRQ